jgi:NAD(P)-dependent dehydrogenase (short-subunit alcohol dehydrogenase family)
MLTKEVQEMGKLDGKVALITGAGSGIGRSTSLLFAKEGAKISVADLNPAGGRQTVRAIKKAGGEAIFVKVDVRKTADVQRMVARTVDSYGRLDILYNNAGISGVRAPVAELSEEDFDDAMNINLRGAFLGSKYAIPVMLKQGGGVIISIASVIGIGATPGGSAYCCSKAGVILLTKTMAWEYARQNIRVNCVCPGTIQTPMVEPWLSGLRTDLLPMGRLGEAEEIARAVLYLASDDSSYVTGHALVVDGGWTAGPMLLV